MELRTLRYFLAVCRESSMTRAAERLHVSQPALSRQVAELERELGHELLVRHSRSVEPTEEGLYLMRRAEDIVELADETEAAMKHGGEVVEGEVTIAAAESAGMHFVAERIAVFRERHPQVTFRLRSGNASMVTGRLQRGMDDFGLLVGYPDVGRFASVRLGATEAWGVLTPEGSTLATHKAVRPSDLVGLPLVASEQERETGALSSWFDTWDVRPNIVATYTLGHNGTELVRAEVGHMLCLEGLFGEGEGTGLVFRPLWPPVTAPVDFAWRRDAPHSHAARLFLEDIRASCQVDAH